MACALEPITEKNTFIHHYNILVFFIALPFGQAVPLFLMIYSSYPALFNKYFRKVKFCFFFVIFKIYSANNHHLNFCRCLL